MIGIPLSVRWVAGGLLAGALFAGVVATMKAFTDRELLTKELAAERVRGTLAEVAADISRVVAEAKIHQLEERERLTAAENAAYLKVIELMKKAEEGKDGEKVKSWRAGGVPDAVRRLHESKACADASDCD